MSEEFGKQPHPEPRPELAPSLKTYAVLLLAAAALGLLPALLSRESYWGGLSANLATELLGAVVILIIVERRLRAGEVDTFRALREAVAVLLMSKARFVRPLLSDRRATLWYVRILRRQLCKIQPPHYLARPHLEHILETYPTGCVLCGPGGSGKTTLVQRLVVSLSDRFLSAPSTPVPVLLPMSKRAPGVPLVPFILGTVEAYFPVRERALRGWMESASLALFLDGLDEDEDKEAALAELQQLRGSHPNLVVIISSRERYDRLGLPTEDLPELSRDDDVQNFLRQLLAGRAYE